jgi:hypothetical protein
MSVEPSNLCADSETWSRDLNETRRDVSQRLNDLNT